MCVTNVTRLVVHDWNDPQVRARVERAKAKPLYEQALFALEILSQVRGGELSGKVARIYVEVLSRLGELERYLMNPVRAKSYIEDSIRLRKKYFGNYHPLVAEGFHQLGHLLQTINKPEAAIQVKILFSHA